MKQVKAVVYSSHAGHTKEYAELLAREIGLVSYELNYALKVLKEGSSIIYMGCIIASQIKGYAKARKHFDIAFVCAVGMATDGKQLEEKNLLNSDYPVFYLQGGFDINKTHGIYRMMMKVAISSISKKLEEKSLSDEEEKMLEMVRVGKNCVCLENLNPVISYFNGLK